MDKKYALYCFKWLQDNPEEIETYAMNLNCLSDEMKFAVMAILEM